MSASGFLLLLISAMIGCAAPQRPCFTSEKDMEENNIMLQWSRAKTLKIPHGDGVNFVCKPGFRIYTDTDMRVECEDGEMDYPKCYKMDPCVTTEMDMEEHNITLKWSNAKTLHIPNGKKAEFECKPGFQVIADTDMRVECEDGDMDYPKCYNLEQECAGPAEQRRECGYKWITEEDCTKRRGCCFDPNANDEEKSCYYTHSDNEAHCGMNPYKRKPCGEPVTSARACLDRGCCFDSNLPRDKWCFAPIEPGDACGGSPYLRRGCGSPGITPYECMQKDCCYDNSLKTEQIRWCFHTRTNNNIQCAVRPLERKQCGDTGITFTECYAKGCCFDSSFRGATLCYYPIDETPCQITESDLDENNLKLKWSDDRTMEVPPNGVVEFDCNPEHESSSNDMRTTCLNGRLNYPKCEQSA